MKLDNLLKNYRKETGSTSAAESELANVNIFYDTGSFALNRVITGDIRKGIPASRITQVYGESQTAKSLVAIQTATLALKRNQIDRIFYVDSEGGGLQMFQNFGADLNKVEHIPVHSIEDCGVKLLKLYDAFMTAKAEYKADAEKNDDIRAIVILDSWGALSADKLINDAVKKDAQVSEMGLSAKLKNATISGLMMRVVQTGVALIIINHTYDNPGALFTSKIKAMPGGKKLEFASHVIIQATKLFIKPGNNEYLTSDSDEAGYYAGNRVNFFTVKNRIAKPCFSADVYIDFENGIAKYDGLIDDAIAYGFIEKVHGGYKVPSYSDKRIFFKDLVTSDEIWNTFIAKFNEMSIERMKFSKSIVDSIKESEATISELVDESI